MAYPLTGASPSAKIKIVVMGNPPIPLKINPTRVTASIPWSGVLTPYFRNVSIKIRVMDLSFPMIIKPTRQWGLAAPITGIISESWGVF